MRAWNQYCLVDIFSQMDPSLLEEEFLEGDLEQLDEKNLWPEAKQRWSGKKIAAVTGVVTGAVAITGAVFFLVKKYRENMAA